MQDIHTYKFREAIASLIDSKALTREFAATSETSNFHSMPGTSAGSHCLTTLELDRSGSSNRIKYFANKSRGPTSPKMSFLAKRANAASYVLALDHVIVLMNGMHG